MLKTVLVRRDALTTTEICETAMPALGDGEVRLAVESFAVTANNVTYAVIGDAFGYWNFFPAPDGFGIVPMWGHARVIESRHAELTVGERVYGYLPMASHLDVLPGRVSAHGFSDAAAHRLPMSPIYNQYSRLAADPEHDPAQEAARMLFGPLFKTGYLIAAMFVREKWFGAANLVMTSASSKTALALAQVARAEAPEVRRIGLTSPANVDFVRASGLYDQVLAYDEIDQLSLASSVSVDFAGNAAVLGAIHRHLGDSLRYSCLVGATHVSARGQGGGAMPGPAPILFFAPDHAGALIAELGAAEFGARVAARWQDFVATAAPLVTVTPLDGLEAAAAAFVATLRGETDPAHGLVVSLAP